MIYEIAKDIFFFLKKLATSQLSTEEIEILEHCSERGEIWVLHTSMSGEWVRSGSHDFANNEDPGYSEFYIEALNRLINRGYVRHVSGDMFRLTGTGFKKARTPHGNNGL